jgi:glycosyltransferase involved in cell wall biosynthesis
MKILLVSSEYPPESPGGLGNAVRNLALGLQSCGAAPYILSSGGNSSVTGRPVTEEDNGIPIIRIAKPKKRLRSEPGWFWRFHPYYLPFDCYIYSRAVAKTCRGIIRSEGIDVVQFADYRGEGFSFVGSGRTIPSVIRLATPLYMVEDINRIRQETPAPLIRRTGAQTLLRRLEQKPIREANAIASPSRSLANLIEKEVAPKGVLRIIPTGIDLGHFAPQPATAMPALETALDRGDKKIILFAGRYEYRKGVHDLIEAFARIQEALPGYMLACAGGDTNTAPGGGSMKRFCEERAAALGIRGQVRLLDRVAHEQLPGLYSLAALFVAPSLYENLANTLLEAMACGLPVISTTSGGATEIIDDPANGTLVAPGDVPALAAAILNLLGEPERCTMIGRANREKARRSFSRETMAAGFLELYRSLRP